MAKCDGMVQINQNQSTFYLVPEGKFQHWKTVGFVNLKVYDKYLK